VGLAILFQQGLRKHPEIPGAPLVTELAETADQKRLLELQSGPTSSRTAFRPIG
jgi:hypothetical protein